MYIKEDMIHTYYPNYDKYQNLKHIGKKRSFSNLISKLSIIIFLLGLVILLIMYLPSLIYLFSSSKVNVSSLLAGSYKQKEEVVVSQKDVIYQPRFNNSLTTKNNLVVRSAGIETEINEATASNYEEALRKGVWRVNDFGTPYDRSLPTILAAHRYGYLKWSIPYRLKNSFYNLPKLKIGDTVEIIWRQRKYLYEVYSEGKGDKVEDYSADLILYTCESLSTSVRIFKYARLIKI